MFLYLDILHTAFYDERKGVKTFFCMEIPQLLKACYPTPIQSTFLEAKHIYSDFL